MRLRGRLPPRTGTLAASAGTQVLDVTAVEALAYRRLTELGAPALRSLRSVGGGAANPVWTRLRARKLGVPMPAPLSAEAAYGAALLALAGGDA